MPKDQDNLHNLPGKPENQEPETLLGGSRLHMEEPWLSIFLEAAIEVFESGEAKIDEGCLILNDIKNPKRDERIKKFRRA